MVNRVYVDSMLSSYLLQATDHPGLQVQNSKGEWVDCPQIPGTFGLFPFPVLSARISLTPKKL